MATVSPLIKTNGKNRKTVRWVGVSTDTFSPILNLDSTISSMSIVSVYGNAKLYGSLDNKNWSEILDIKEGSTNYFMTCATSYKIVSTSQGNVDISFNYELIRVGIKDSGRNFYVGLPYITDSNLYVWDFSKPVLNGTKIIRVPEMSRGISNAFEQSVYASQPDATANGARFTSDLSRRMEIVAGGAVPLNGSTGVYAAYIEKIDAAFTTVPTTLKIYGGYNLSRNGRFMGAPLTYGDKGYNSYGVTDDSNSWIQRTNPTLATNAGTWYVHEWLYDLGGNSVRYWQNGIEDLSVIHTNAFSTTTFPATDSLGAVIGENLSGEVKAVVIYDGVPTNSVRQSISDWLVRIKP